MRKKRDNVHQNSEYEEEVKRCLVFILLTIFLISSDFLAFRDVFSIDFRTSALTCSLTMCETLTLIEFGQKNDEIQFSKNYNTLKVLHVSDSQTL